METLEEIGMRGRETFLQAGGEQLTLIPCLNEHPLWLKALENDKRLILKAATQAHAAADYIMNKATEIVTVGIEESTFIN